MNTNANKPKREHRAKTCAKNKSVDSRLMAIVRKLIKKHKKDLDYLKERGD